MQTGATNMDSNTVELETDELLQTGFYLPEKVTQTFQERVLQKIPDDLMQAFGKHNAIIAGGCFVPDAFIKDIDLFFPTIEDANNCYKAIAKSKYTNTKGKANLKWYWEEFAFEFIRFKQFSSPSELFDSFDISVAQVGYDCATGNYHYSAVAAEDYTQNQFRVLSVNCVLRKQLERISKYRDKGLDIHPSTWKVIEEAAKLPDTELAKRFGEEYMEGTSIAEPRIRNDAPARPDVRQIELVFNALAQADRAVNVRGLDAAANQRVVINPAELNW